MNTLKTVTLVILATCTFGPLTAMRGTKTITQQNNEIDIIFKDFSGPQFDNELKNFYAILDAYEIPHPNKDAFIIFDKNTPRNVYRAFLNLNIAVVYDALNMCIFNRNQENWQNLLDRLIKLQEIKSTNIIKEKGLYKGMQKIYNNLEKQVIKLQNLSDQFKPLSQNNLLTEDQQKTETYIEQHKQISNCYRCILCKKINLINNRCNARRHVERVHLSSSQSSTKKRKRNNNDSEIINAKKTKLY